MPIGNYHTGQGKRHQLFADAADRDSDATKYVVQDLNAQSLQIDTGDVFYLQSIHPTVWAPQKAEASVNRSPFFAGGKQFQNQFVIPGLTDDVDAIDLPIPVDAGQGSQIDLLYAMQLSWFGRSKGGGDTNLGMALGIVRRDDDGVLTTFGTGGGFPILQAGTINLANPVAYVLSGQNARWRLDQTGSSDSDVIVTGVISPGFSAAAF